MAQYIDKDALVAEIDKQKIGYNTDGKHPVEYNTVKKILDILDTLEVKEIGVDLGDPEGDKSAKYIIDTKTLEVREVDLEKHLKEDIEDVFFDLNGVAVKGATYYLTVEDVKDIAKHFFELGMSVNNKAQKGE